MKPSTAYVDDRALNALIAESEDLHLSGLRDAESQVGDLREAGFERRHDPVNEEEIQRYEVSRRGFLRRIGLGGGELVRGGIFAGAFGTALAGLIARPAAADTALDVQILQTASALEMVAVATYEAALGLDFIQNGNEAVIAFAETTVRQHAEHAMAFRAQTAALGGQEQNTPHPGGQEIVNAALPGLSTALDVVRLAEQLETIATHTYLESTMQLEDSVAKQLVASVMGVESQHAGVLRVFATLLDAGAPELVAVPSDPARLPAAAGSVATPEAVEPTTSAVAPDSGAIAPGEG